MDLRDMSGEFKGIGVVGGMGQGPEMVTERWIPFNPGIDDRIGIVNEYGRPLKGERIAGRDTGR